MAMNCLREPSWCKVNDVQLKKAYLPTVRVWRRGSSNDEEGRGKKKAEYLLKQLYGSCRRSSYQIVGWSGKANLLVIVRNRIGR